MPSDKGLEVVIEYCFVDCNIPLHIFHDAKILDLAGDTIDFMLSPKRDRTAAKLLLRWALSGTGGIRPRVINVDGHPA